MKSLRSLFVMPSSSLIVAVTAVLMVLFIIDHSVNTIAVVAFQSSSSQLLAKKTPLPSNRRKSRSSNNTRNAVVAFTTTLRMAATPPPQQHDERIDNEDAVAIPATAANVAAYLYGLNRNAKELFAPIPPPEDQFIITGDIAVLFMYAFTSHSINDSIVTQILNNHDRSLVQSIQELDPTGTIVNTHALSVWVNTANDPVAVQHALEVAARESFMNHWGPLLSTEGSACVALCSCWLLAGYLHRAFLYENSTYCDSSQALKTTIKTWMTSAVLLVTFAIGTDFLIGHGPPLLQNFLCVTCHNTPESHLFVEGPGLGYGAIIKDVVAGNAASNSHGGSMDSLLSSPSSLSVLSTLTQSDVMFIVDSLTVLIAWRWTANRISNLF